MNKKTILIIIGILVVICLFITTAAIRRTWFNKIEYEVKKADEATNYYTKKGVEDACRAMITSYKNDVLTYQTYIKTDNPTKQEWAEQAKIRANKTAVEFNEFVLKNSYVWKDNVPADIEAGLPYLE